MLKKIFVISLLILAVHSYMSRDFFYHKDEQGKEIRRPIRSLLLGWHKYITNLAQEYIYEIEDYGLCNFHLNDFTQNISRIFFGYEVNGTVQYTKGFIGTLQSVHLLDEHQALIDEATQTTSIRTKLIMNNLMLYFNYVANLTKSYFSGTVAIPIKTIEFSLKVNKDYKINKIEGTVYDITAKFPYKDMRWYYEPSNVYTEIIDRDVAWGMFDDLQRLANTTMKKLLKNVIQRYTYPQMCLDCNDKMQLFEYNLKEQENY